MTPSVEKQARLTAEEARLRLEIRDDSLYWKNGPHAGMRAGSLGKDGYWRVEIKNSAFLVHRVVWLIANGAWPPGDIDHRDTDKGNNRPANLRPASESFNLENQKRAHSQNLTGLLGVSMRAAGKYRAQITVKGERKKLGTFSTPELAHAAYLVAKRQFHEGNTL